MDTIEPPDPDLASELRQGAGQDWIEEAAEDERLTETHRRRRLTLEEQAKEMVNRGNRVSVEFGGHSFNGAVVGAGSDYVTVDGPGQVADIRMAAARWSVLPLEGREGGGVAAPESFRALLNSHADSSKNLRLSLPGGDMVIGKISVVAEDHVEMQDVDDRRLVVPMNLILAVVRSAEAQ